MLQMPLTLWLKTSQHRSSLAKRINNKSAQVQTNANTNRDLDHAVANIKNRATIYVVRVRGGVLLGVEKACCPIVDDTDPSDVAL